MEIEIDREYRFDKCYTCAYRTSVPGSAHLQCSFDWIKAITEVKIPTHPVGLIHGIKSGWFTFPFDFDPVWIGIPCFAYVKKGTDKPLYRSEETLRVLVAMKFRQQGMTRKVTEDEFTVFKTVWDESIGKKESTKVEPSI